MRLADAQPFRIIYSLYQHEYLGYLVECYAVVVYATGKLTLQAQAVSPKNMDEFGAELDEQDRALIPLCQTLRHENLARRFGGRKPLTVADFFARHFLPRNSPPTVVRQAVLELVDETRHQIMKRLPGRALYAMGQDGNPAWRPLTFADDQATVRFHVHRNEGDTHYYPTLRYQGRRLDFVGRGAGVISYSPAMILIGEQIYRLAGQTDGRKLLPFLEKKFIAIPRKVEDSYFRKFLCPLLATEDVVAPGFHLEGIVEEPRFEFVLEQVWQPADGLFESTSASTTSSNPVGSSVIEGPKAQLEATLAMAVRYGEHRLSLVPRQEVSVHCRPEGGTYRFVRVYRDMAAEMALLEALEEASGTPWRSGRLTKNLGELVALLQRLSGFIAERGITVSQELPAGRRYHLSPPRLELEARATLDWLELRGRVELGGQSISFYALRQALREGRQTLEAPDGTLIYIPADLTARIDELMMLARTPGEGKPGGSRRTQDIEPAGGDPPLLLAYHHGTLLTPYLEEGSLRLLDADSDDQASFHGPSGSIGAAVQGPGTRTKRGPAAALARRLAALSAVQPYPVPETFRGSLRPYQQTGYAWMRTMAEAGMGVILADDMGLGKTVQTLAVLAALREAEPDAVSLLIVPNSLLHNWEREAARFAPTLTVLKHIGPGRARVARGIRHGHLVITSYGTLRSDVALLAQIEFAYLILDEAHAVKNHGSHTAKAVAQIRARHRLSLTGTPIENNLTELWSQLNLLNPGLLGSQSWFRQEFSVPIERHADETRLERLRRLIQPFVLRRLKQQVAQDLPDKSEQVIFCEMAPAQQALYDRVRNAYRHTLLEQAERGGQGASKLLLLRGLTHLRQIACHPALTEPDYADPSGKFESVCFRLTQILDEGHKVLVFSQFVRHLSLLKQWLDERQIAYSYLDGKTKDRAAAVDQFEREEGRRVFLLSLKAGGTGLNLTAADYVFLLDPWWNPAAEAQAIDRAHRIGQRRKVFIARFISRGSVEERILEMQERKRTLATTLIGHDEGGLEQLTDEDIRQIFS